MQKMWIFLFLVIILLSNGSCVSHDYNIRRLETGLDELEKDANKLSKDISELDNSLNEISKDISELDNSLNEISNNLDRIKYEQEKTHQKLLDEYYDKLLNNFNEDPIKDKDGNYWQCIYTNTDKEKKYYIEDILKYPKTNGVVYFTTCRMNKDKFINLMIAIDDHKSYLINQLISNAIASDSGEIQILFRRDTEKYLFNSWIPYTIGKNENLENAYFRHDLRFLAFKLPKKN